MILQKHFCKCTYIEVLLHIHIYESDFLTQFHNYRSASVNVHIRKRFCKCTFMEALPYMHIYRSTYVYAHL
jgi:hypothetical protein